MLNYGEQKGARKSARALATQQRRERNTLKAKQLAECPASQNEAAARWDEFYQTKPTLFKDRHILRGTFPELVGPEAAANPKKHFPPLDPAPQQLVSNPITEFSLSPTEQFLDAKTRGCDLIVLEAGCGGGNALFPLLRANPRLFALAFDFSDKAVSIVQQSPEYRSGRIHGFRADLAAPHTYLDVLKDICATGATFVTAFWTLSALPSAQHEAAVQGLASALAVGGTLCFRDYAIGDMREHKFLARGKRVAHDESARLFLRGDGTYAYFFEEAEIRSLFEKAGLLCKECTYEERLVENRKERLVMRRRWLQASFTKPSESSQPSSTSST